MMNRSIVLFLSCASIATLLPAARSLPSAVVSVQVADGRRVITSNGIPDHAPGTFPRKGNPNSIATQDYSFSVPLKPEVASQRTPSAHAYFGVAINGVPFEPGTAEFWNFDRGSGWKYEAMSGKIDLGLDQHNAHVQPNGSYHYHGLPAGLIERLGGDGKTMRLVGYAADGFPIYTSFDHVDPKNAASPLKKMRASWKVKSGTRPDGPGGRYDGTFTADYEYVASSGDLDECNGRFGVTPEYPEGIYHYCITAEFPQLSRQWKGTPDESFQKGPPGGGPGGRGGPPGMGRGGPGGPGGPQGGGGRPPRGGSRRGGPGAGAAQGQDPASALLPAYPF